MPARLVVCLDGTSNSPFIQVEREDGSRVLKPTNPLKIARSILPVDERGDPQVTYYDSGVGALGVFPGFSNKLLRTADRVLGGIWGAGFETNIEEAATFIANNFTCGADVFVFGYSRGAAQARALVKFLDWLGGITPKKDAYYLPLFFREYCRTKGTGDPASLRRDNGYTPAEHLVDFQVRLLGVFDTVIALGSRTRTGAINADAERAFHIDTAPPACVEHARQALAIDEERYDFRPEIWSGPSHPKQTLEQRWFPGVHGNVGGSLGLDGLANGALHWMMAEARALGLECDNDFLCKYRPYAADKIGVSYTPFYRRIDWVRGRAGRGKRSLKPPNGGAHLDIDPSAIIRFCLDHQSYDRMDGPYRPDGLVDVFRKAKIQSNEAAFFRSYGLNPARFQFPADI